jgi:tetratricopeptide (TPR) repeat protein
MKRALLFILLLLMVLGSKTFAQPPDAKSLTRDGVELSNQKNYAGAIEQYKAALNTDPDYAPGNYQMAFALNAMGKGLDGIPYLERVFKSTTASTNLIGGAYDLAGSIYDQNHQPQKAIESYLAGIKANPTYQPLQYNLALAYFRGKQYADAEATAEQAIKLDPKHASSMRIYALVCFHQNKRAQALLGFCSFLAMEPNTARSAEAYGNIRHILQGGALKPEPGAMTSAETKALANSQNQTLTKALTSVAGHKYASAADLLSAQLKAIFSGLTSMPRDKYYYWYAIADYFGKLAQSPNMPALVRLISLSEPASAQWAKDNAQRMTDLDTWLKTTERGF